MSTIPNGRYAITFNSGVTRFFEVNTPTEGKWSGYTFLSIQASDDLHPVRDREKRTAVLNMIRKDPQTASALYGQKIGRCGICHKTLTDETSRAYGIGPVCREKF